MKKERVFAVMAALAVPAAVLGTVAPEPVHAGIASSVAAAPKDSHDREIRKVFDDVLDREPTDRELRRYRELMEDDDWSTKDVREDLKRRQSNTRSRSSSRGGDPDRIVRRAYQDVLGREADASGLRNYRRRITEDDWSEDDVRDALRRSPEYRQKNTMTRERAEEVVRQAYRSVLEREPDAGSRGYVDRVLREGWTEQDVARELRKSDEYRAKNR
jgi:hypothetical protein